MQATDDRDVSTLEHAAWRTGRYTAAMDDEIMNRDEHKQSMTISVPNDVSFSNRDGCNYKFAQRNFPQVQPRVRFDQNISTLSQDNTIILFNWLDYIASTASTPRLCPLILCLPSVSPPLRLLHQKFKRM